MKTVLGLKFGQLLDYLGKYEVLDSAQLNVLPLPPHFYVLVLLMKGRYNFTVSCLPHTPVNQMLPRGSNVLHYGR